MSMTPSLGAPQTPSIREARGKHSQDGNSRRSSEGIPQTVVVYQPSFQLNFRVEVLECGERVTNVVDDLEKRQKSESYSHGEITYSERSYSPFVWYIAQRIRQTNTESRLYDGRGHRHTPNRAQRPD
jgi:hypothetical protein